MPDSTTTRRPHSPTEVAAELDRLRRRVAELEQQLHGLQPNAALRQSLEDPAPANLTDRSFEFLAQSRVLHCMTQGVSISDEDGRIRYTNPAEDAIFGYGPGELIGQHVGVRDAYPPEEGRRRFAEAIARVQTTGAWTGEWRNKKRDGAGFRTFARISGVEVDGHKYLVWVHEDLTELRRAGEALWTWPQRAEDAPGAGEERPRERCDGDVLREPHEFLRALVASSPLPIVVFNTAGNITVWNPAAERVFGWRAEEVLGKPIPFIPEDKLEEHREMRAQDLRGGGFTEHEIRRRRKDGTPVDLLVSTAPLRGEPGAITAIMSVYVDITARKRAEERLRESERELRLVTDDAPVYLAHCDKSARYKFVNRGYAERFGLAAHELIGKHISEVAGRQAYERFRGYVEAALAGQRVDFEMEVPYEQLGPRFVRCAYVPALGPAGEPDGLVAVMTDISEHKEAERQRQLLLEVIDNSPDFIGIAAPDQRALFVNRAGQALVGLDGLEAVRNTRILDYFPEEDREYVERDIFPDLFQRGSWDGEVRFRNQRTGEPISMLWNVFTIPDPLSGKLAGFACVARNISDRKRLDEQLRQTQKLESLGLLAGGIAHDFNNLLAGILGSASLAQDTLPHDHAVQPLLRIVTDASERAAHLTRQMLAYSGKGQFVVTPIDLAAFVQENLPLLQVSIGKNVHLRVETEPNLPPIEADPGQLQQVLMNLVINGAEAIGSDRPGTVVVRTGVEQVQDPAGPNMFPDDLAPGRYVILQVRDTGCGMDEATRARIFDPFFTTKFTGRGLGLAAVLGIVRGHKGALTVNTAPNQGTTFAVYLPAADVLADLVRPARTAGGWRGTGVVLVVDDEEIVRRTTRAMLEHFGYTVLVAEQGNQAVELLHQRREISLVLLDLTMPEMNGEQTASQLKRIRPDVPVILSSGYSEAEATRRFERSGLAGFLQKPYTAAALVLKIRAVAGSGASG